jgi:hypothetical protein
MSGERCILARSVADMVLCFSLRRTRSCFECFLVLGLFVRYMQVKLRLMVSFQFTIDGTTRSLLTDTFAMSTSKLVDDISLVWQLEAFPQKLFISSLFSKTSAINPSWRS